MKSLVTVKTDTNDLSFLHLHVLIYQHFMPTTRFIK